MKIIAFEGLDKSGKNTSANHLVNYLKDKGSKVVIMDFHQYESPTGKLIMQYLQGTYDVSKETIELIMAADKQAKQDYFNQLNKEGIDYLILDRYTGSQLVYSKSLGNDEEWIKSLISKMISPDLEIILDVPPEVSMARKGKHNNGENDKYESDFKLLTMVRENYLKYVEESDNRYVVNGNRPKSEVVEDVVKLFDEIF